MRRTLLLLTGIIISIFANSQSMLCLYKGGYFIRNGNSWFEYRPQSKDGVWSTYSQQSSDNNYYYIKNSACELSIPKKKNNSVWIKKGGKWEVIYTTIKIYDYCPKRSSHLFCFDNGFFIKNGTTWYLYMPDKEKKSEWNTYTEYSKDDSYYYISNSNDKITIPRSSNNSFYLLDNGKWKEWHSALALYDAHSPKANSGNNYIANSPSSSSKVSSSERNSSNSSNSHNSGKRKWREESSFGMFYSCVEQNGITNKTLYGICPACRGTSKCGGCYGTGICSICQGRGGIITSGYGNYLACTACFQTGKCNICKGTGKCVCANSEFPGYTPGSSTLYGVDGKILSTTSFLSGGSSSSSSSSKSNNNSSTSRSSCSRCGGTGVDPNPSSGGNLTAWVAHYNATGDNCPYCNRVYEHWHTKCSTCNVPR